MKTIRQIADEIGVSKQAVRKHISKLPPTCISTGANQTILINKAGCAILQDKIAIGANRSTTVDTNISSNQVPTNKDQIILELQHKIEKLELEKELEGKSIAEKVSIYKEILEKKDIEIDRQQQIMSEQVKSLSELTAALENTTASLKASQALHAGTMHKQLAAGSEPDREIEATTEQTKKKKGFFSWLKNS